ncbi:MAG: histidine--tRNA ligase [Thermoanaerobacteraceae bacterium]|nr:histidine--tRNA ligase [Thermoanaerobacteraceae bacterium]
MSTTPVRGTKDYTPKEVEIRDYIQSVILNTYQRSGFQKISTPIMEDIERLNTSEGGENLNLIFKILKRGEKLNLNAVNLNENDLVDIGLRYDLTLPLARYFANNQNELRYPFKCIQIDKVFRAERPQKGRLREFFQCDIDIIGEDSINAEIELIYTTSLVLLNLGFSDFTVRINDRRILTNIIANAGFRNEDIANVCIIFDKLDKIGWDGVQSELLKKGFETQIVKKFIDTVSNPLINKLENLEGLSIDYKILNDVKTVLSTIETLSRGKYSIKYDISLVRGMGYYTGMVFEIVSPLFSSSIAGGGRYDKMIGKFMDKQIPAVGFSIGFERIASIILENNMINLPKNKSIALLYCENDVFCDVITKAESLRMEKYDVAIIKRGKNLGKQFKFLQKEGFDFAFVFWENKLKNLKEW